MEALQHSCSGDDIHFLLGMISWRQPMAINSLCAAGFLILVQSTNELFNPGFQLSFVVVAGILLFAIPIRDGLRKKFSPIRSFRFPYGRAPKGGGTPAEKGWRMPFRSRLRHG